jgi:hypothetical protein
MLTGPVCASTLGAATVVAAPAAATVRKRRRLVVESSLRFIVFSHLIFGPLKKRPVVIWRKDNGLLVNLASEIPPQLRHGIYPGAGLCRCENERNPCGTGISFIARCARDDAMNAQPAFLRLEA